MGLEEGGASRALLGSRIMSCVYGDDGVRWTTKSQLA